MSKVSPGGVGDGLPSLPDGEPVLARWFVLAMLALVIIGSGVSIWAFMSFTRDALPVAARRPPGTTTETHFRGSGVLAEDTTPELGPDCARSIEIVGDAGGRATGRRALQAVCSLLESGDYPQAQAGLRNWADQSGVLRITVFEVTGLDSTARVEDGKTVIELSPRFQFDDAARAAPMILHELVHLAGDWPGQPVDAQGEYEAMLVQAAACDQYDFGDNAPLGCADAWELRDAADAIEQIRAAGYGAG